MVYGLLLECNLHVIVNGCTHLKIRSLHTLHSDFLTCISPTVHCTLLLAILLCPLLVLVFHLQMERGSWSFFTNLLFLTPFFPLAFLTLRGGMDDLLWSIPAVMDINKCPVYFIFLIIEHHQGIFEGEQAGLRKEQDSVTG